MNAPLLSTSMAEFWGSRWNVAFRDLSRDLIYAPLRSRSGAACGLLAVFLASGLVHDLVISVPARAGYGLPTAYFLLQGGLVLFERKRGAGLGNGWPYPLRRALIVFCVLAPAVLLFHPWFLERVALGFLAAIGATGT